MVRLFYLDSEVVVCAKPAGVLSESGGMPELLNSQIGWGRRAASTVSTWPWAA